MVLLMAAFVVNAQRTPIKVTDLQKSITDNITKDYPGFIIKDAARIVNNGVTTFEVKIDKGTTSETLLFDNYGKFLKKENMKTGMTEKSGMKNKSGSEHMAHKSVPKKK